jgi:hypothetical protein
MFGTALMVATLTKIDFFGTSWGELCQAPAGLRLGLVTKHCPWKIRS